VGSNLSKAAALLDEAMGLPSQQSQEPVNIEDATTEILLLKRQTAANLWEIGNRLIQVKRQLPHGEWGTWLKEKVEFSQQQASRLMRVAEEFPNYSTLSNLGRSQIFALLSVPSEERDAFIKEPHQLSSGAVKTVNEMSARELQEAIKAKQEAERIAQKAQEDAALFQQSEQEARALAHEHSETIKELEKKLEDRPEIIVEKPPDDYNEFKQKAKQADVASKTVEELKRKVEQEANRNKALELEVKAYQTGRVDEKMSVQVKTGVFSKKVKEFIDSVASMGYLSREYLYSSPECQRQYETAIDMLEKFCKDMRGNLVIPEKGNVIDVEVIE